MSIYKFANLYVDMSPFGMTLKKQSLKYQYANEKDIKPDISLFVPIDKIVKTQRMYPQLSFDDTEYMLYGEQFYTQLLCYDGFLLHSSAVAYNGNAYLFSAPCGTGKSTHVSIWLKVFSDNAFCINDDKPAIRRIDGKFCACGTPFSGKTDTSRNECVPIKGICVLERGRDNKIEKIDAKDAVYAILNQTIRPADKSLMTSLLSIIDELSASVPVYRLFCNMDDEAALVAYRGMSGN